jgi:siroheme synthase
VDTLVILMGVGALPRIAARLQSAGRSAATPAAVIHRGTTEAGETVVGTLGDIAFRASHLTAPAVIVIGEVVALHSLPAHPPLDAVAFDRR